MTTGPDHLVVVEEFAELRRSIDVGLARIDGQLALLAQRNEQIDRDLSDLAARVGSLEHGRWPLPAVAALTALGALAVALWEAVGG
ncbi:MULTISPECIES: hypothetical protein [Streptomyces]|uniref:DUF3618 domain-containing protein n=1 Tax=Streptomyces chengmaiensis TaxID=3040919 RepID=A0ABT6HU47_9ACTN|nr:MULTISPECIES: hypothetical protein [Streptomyces]MDH2392241.1 hypothetical protein [Streptomyces chengmaiensis]WRQ78566.1 hypothetical protein I3F59_003755 [Streptomyces sp. MUM 178J]